MQSEGVPNSETIFFVFYENDFRKDSHISSFRDNL